MSSVEAPSRRNIFKDVLGPGAAIALTIAISGGSRLPSQPISAGTNNESGPHPQQQYGIFDYGHRGAERIRKTRDIASGVTPVNGISLGEADVPLIFQDISRWTNAGLTFAAESYAHINDRRNNYFRFLTEEIPDLPGNPNPDFDFTVILENGAYGNPTIHDWRRDLTHLAPYMKMDNFLKNDKNLSAFFVFSKEIEGILDNPGWVEMWAILAREFNVFPILQDYTGSNLNPHHDQVGWFSYAEGFLTLRPSGINITKDVARVTFGYAKKGDLKLIPRNYNAIAERTEMALNSGAEFVVFSTDDEGAEESQADEVVFEILGEIIPK